MADLPDFVPPDWVLTVRRNPTGMIVLRGRPQPTPRAPDG